MCRYIASHYEDRKSEWTPLVDRIRGSLWKSPRAKKPQRRVSTIGMENQLADLGKLRPGHPSPSRIRSRIPKGLSREKARSSSTECNGDDFGSAAVEKLLSDCTHTCHPMPTLDYEDPNIVIACEKQIRLYGSRTFPGRK